MEARYKKKFLKMLHRCPVRIQERFFDRLELLLEDENHPTLNIHKLSGDFADLWSMNVTGDYRALFHRDGNTLIIFALIGTHHQLYSK